MKTIKRKAIDQAISDYLAGIGRFGGSVKSYAKSAAARVNGCKGGRPRLHMCKRCRWIHDMRCPLTAHERFVRIHDPSCRFGPRCHLYEDVLTPTSEASPKPSGSPARKARPSKQKKKG